MPSPPENSTVDVAHEPVSNLRKPSEKPAVETEVHTTSISARFSREKRASLSELFFFSADASAETSMHCHEAPGQDGVGPGIGGWPVNRESVEIRVSGAIILEKAVKNRVFT